MAFNSKNFSIAFVVMLLLAGKTFSVDMVADAGDCMAQGCEDVSADLSKQCNNVYNLTVRHNATVGNNLTVAGTITGGSFATPSGPLFTGLRNYAVLTNQAAIATGTNIVPFAETPSGNLSSGITNVGGSITLPTSGLFLVMYTVRLDRSPISGTFTAMAQLQQTVSGTPTNISQPAIVNNTSSDGIDETIPAMETQITGYALITITSSANNVINLNVTVSDAEHASMPVATGTDANAQMVILQLN